MRKLADVVQADRVFDAGRPLRQVFVVGAVGLEAALDKGQPASATLTFTFGGDGRVTAEAAAQHGGAGRNRVAHHHPSHVGSGVDIQADAPDVATAGLAGHSLLDGRDCLLHTVAGRQRCFDRHCRQGLYRGPGLAAALLLQGQRLRCSAGSTLPGQEGRVVGVHALRGRRAEPVAAAGLGTGRQACNLAPVDGLLAATHAQQRLAAYRASFRLGGKAFQRQAAPQVGIGGLPGAVLLAGDEAVDQKRQLVLPRRVIHHRQDQAGAVHVTVLHQPPPVIVLIVAELQAGALVAQACTQDLVGFGQQRIAVRNGGHALQDAQPVDHGMRGPLVGCQRDAG